MRSAAARAALAATAAGALLGAVEMTSFDLPLMLAAGDRLLETGAVPQTNPWHWPHPRWPWLDDKWGFGLLCAGAERLGGAAGLTLLNVVLGAALAALVFRLAARRRAVDSALRADLLGAQISGSGAGEGRAAWHAAGVALAAVTVLSYRSMLRAEWVSYLGVAWTLLHLDGIVAGSWKRGLAVVLAMPLWAACHVYWVLGPAVVLVAALLARSAAGVAGAVAAFWAGAISPYGLANLAHPMLVARGASVFEDGIAELRVPFLSGPVTYLHLAAAFAAVTALRWSWDAWRAGRPGETFVVVLLVVAGLRFDRNLALLGVALAYAAPPVDAAAPVRWTRWPGWIAVPAAAGLVLGIGWLAPERTLGIGWDERAFPARLVASLPAESRSHRYVNDFSLGSFLDRARGSSFIDGNTHGWPASHFALYREALEGTRGVAEIDAQFPNDGWLLRTSAPHTRVLVVGLFLEGDYAPTDADGVATLFRQVPDAERADDLWRRWLAETYLPAARAWFADPEALAAASGGPPPKDDVAARRALVLANPWHRPFLDALRESYDARGDRGAAARVWRLVRRL